MKGSCQNKTVAVVVLFMNNFGQKGFYQSQELGLADALKKEGFDVDVYKCSAERDSVDDYNGYHVYYRRVRHIGTHAVFAPERFFRRRYDTIIAFCDTQLIVPRLYKYCRRNGIRFIPYVGNTESVAFTKRSKKKLMDELFHATSLQTYRKCGRVFCKSTDTMRNLTRMGVPEESLVFSPVGINLSMLNSGFLPEDASMLREEFGYSPDDRVLLFVGRMNHEKRPLDMFRILDRLDNADADRGDGADKADGAAGNKYKLILIGDGILSDKVDEMAEMFPGRVKYLRKVPYDNMWKYYAAADYFVNLWNQEIFGMAICEAIYYMTPTFLIKAPGPEFIAEGMENSRLCSDIDEIAEAIKAYRYNEESLRRDRERLIENCSWNRFVRNLEVY